MLICPLLCCQVLNPSPLVSGACRMEFHSPHRGVHPWPMVWKEGVMFLSTGAAFACAVRANQAHDGVLSSLGAALAREGEERLTRGRATTRRGRLDWMTQCAALTQGTGKRGSRSGENPLSTSHGLANGPRSGTLTFPALDLFLGFFRGQFPFDVLLNSHASNLYDAIQHVHHALFSRAAGLGRNEPA